MLEVILIAAIATITIHIVDIVQEKRVSRTMERFHNPSDNGIDVQLGDSVAEVMNANRRPEPHRTVAQDEVDHLRTIIRNYIKAEQNMNYVDTDYFALDSHEQMMEALEAWKNAYQALEEEANRGL